MGATRLIFSGGKCLSYKTSNTLHVGIVKYWQTKIIHCTQNKIPNHILWQQ